MWRIKDFCCIWIVCRITIITHLLRSGSFTQQVPFKAHSHSCLFICWQSKQKITAYIWIQALWWNDGSSNKTSDLNLVSKKCLVPLLNKCGLVCRVSNRHSRNTCDICIHDKLAEQYQSDIPFSLHLMIATSIKMIWFFSAKPAVAAAVFRVQFHTNKTETNKSSYQQINIGKMYIQQQAKCQKKKEVCFGLFEFGNEMKWGIYWIEMKTIAIELMNLFYRDFSIEFSELFCMLFVLV